MSIDKIIDDILKVEGAKFTNDPDDRGGATKYGVTQRTLSAYLGQHVSAARVAAMTEAEARAIYYEIYVVKPGFAEVLKRSALISEELVDAGVNCGVHRASEWLQRVLNVLNRRASDFPDIKVDGDVGPATLASLDAFLRHRGATGERVLFRALNSLQGAHYVTLAERDARQQKYVFGWFANRVT